MCVHLNLHRKRRYPLRQVIDAVRYICRTGCQWRCLPASFPPWPLVYYYFARWQVDGTWQRLSQASNRADRQAQQRPPTPSRALADAQSVKLAPRLSQHRGLDAHKCVNGRKRQLLCGLIADYCRFIQEIRQFTEYEAICRNRKSAYLTERAFFCTT